MKRALLTLAAVIIPAIASAQDTPKVGVTMAAPSAIGILWQVADRIAVRPEVTLSRTAAESNQTDPIGSPLVTSHDSYAVGVGIGALFYVGRWDSLRTYLVPRFSYTRSSTSAAINNNTILGPSTSESRASNYQTSGAFGGQYTFGRHFGLFGEAGVSYTRTNTSASTSFTTTVTTFANGAITQTTRVQTSGSSTRANAISTRTAVGVILYF
jgi:hypothetical protein